MESDSSVRRLAQRWRHRATFIAPGPRGMRTLFFVTRHYGLARAYRRNKRTFTGEIDNYASGTLLSSLQFLKRRSFARCSLSLSLSRGNRRGGCPLIREIFASFLRKKRRRRKKRSKKKKSTNNFEFEQPGVLFIARRNVNAYLLI